MTPEITAELLLKDAEDAGRRSYRSKLNTPSRFNSTLNMIKQAATSHGVAVTAEDLDGAYSEGWRTEAKQNPHPKTLFEQITDALKWD